MVHMFYTELFYGFLKCTFSSGPLRNRQKVNIESWEQFPTLGAAQDTVSIRLFLS